MAELLKDLMFKSGSVNPSGIRPIAFWIDKQDIVGFPEIADTPINVSDTVTLEGDFVLKSGAFWKRFYSTQGKGSVDFEDIGEKDTKMFKNLANLKFPDLSDEAVAMAKGSMNTNLVFVVMKRASAVNKPLIKAVVIGSKDYDIDIKTKGTSGKEPGSEKGLTVEIEAPDFIPVPRYVGEIILEDGTYDCASDTFTPSTPATLAATVSVTHTQGDMGGTITVNATGGTKPYIYSLNQGPFQLSNKFAGVDKKTEHRVTVKDYVNDTVDVTPIIVS